MEVLTEQVLHESVGFIKYANDPLKLIVQVDQQLADYYRSLIPKYKDSQPQKYPAHVSVVRNEIPPNMGCWGKYEGKEICFHYSPTIRCGTVYYWINVFSRELEEIRIELGLPASSVYTRPPEPFVKCFHCTLANCKK